MGTQGLGGAQALVFRGHWLLPGASATPGSCTHLSTCTHMPGIPGALEHLPLGPLPFLSWDWRPELPRGAQPGASDLLSPAEGPQQVTGLCQPQGGIVVSDLT